MRSQLESIRPKIKTITNEKETSKMESFQNKTLRPILKFQNSLVLSIFLNHLKKHKQTFQHLTDAKRNEFIEEIIKKDRKINQLLLGIVIGHFTGQEYQSYIENEKELNRRVINMLIQRLQSQL